MKMMRRYARARARERDGGGGRVHRREELGREQPAGGRDRDRERCEECRAGTDDAPGRIGIAGADVLRDQDRRRHRHPEHATEQEEHDGVRVRRGAERRLAEEAAYPDRVHRAIHRLQHVAEQDRQRECDQCLCDRTFGQRRSGGLHQGLSSINSTDFPTVRPVWSSSSAFTASANGWRAPTCGALSSSAARFA